MTSFKSNGHGPKTRGKGVAPILRKFTQSERNSLDLDRSAEYEDDLGMGIIYDYGNGTACSSHDQLNNGRRGHIRNTSGTSQFSTDSGPRSFTHPKQQRPYTPPIPSYHSSSPIPNEDEELRQHPFRSTSNLSNRSTSLNSGANPTVHAQPSLRIQTKQPAGTSRLALAASNTSLNNFLSPLSPDLVSPSDSIAMSPSSAMRTSIDKTFRVRSHSHQDSRPRTESIVEARRKFQEKEIAKEEKNAREEIRQLEKRNEREAKKLERGHRRSSASDGRPNRTKRSKSDLTMQSEKGEVFVGHDYGSTAHHNSPYAVDGSGEIGAQSRTYTATTAKKKTHSAWTKFMMWFRTRFIRMGRK